MTSYYIRQQSLFKLQLNKKYYLELVSIPFLNLKDTQENSLTLYESDYTKLRSYLHNNSIAHFTDLTPSEKIAILEMAKVRIVRYFNDENIKKYELDIKSSLGTGLSDIVSMNGTTLLKDGKQNCIVLYDKHIYIHPKVRSVIGAIDYEVIHDSEKVVIDKTGVIGIYHSSLCQGRQVSFAGSIVQDRSGNWIIENTSGHYITRAYQIKAILNALEENEMDLSKFMVKIWIANNPKVILPNLDESDFTIILENAAEYMSRMRDSQARYR